MLYHMTDLRAFKKNLSSNISQIHLKQMKNGYYLLASKLAYFELIQDAETRFLSHNYFLMG